MNSDNPADIVIGARVKQARLDRGLSQAALAEKLVPAGITHQQTILKIERGSRPLRLAEAAALAFVLDVPLSLFTDGLEQPLREAQAQASLDAAMSAVSALDSASRAALLTSLGGAR